MATDMWSDKTWMDSLKEGDWPKRLRKSSPISSEDSGTDSMYQSFEDMHKIELAKGSAIKNETEVEAMDMKRTGAVPKGVMACCICGEIPCCCDNDAHFWEQLSEDSYKVLSLEEFILESDEPVVAAPSLPCMEPLYECAAHKGVVANIFCDTCGQPSCSDCVPKYHGRHACLYVNEAVKNSESVFRDFLAWAECNTSIVNDRIQKIQREQRCVDARATATVAEVTTSFALLKKAIDDREKHLLDRLKKMQSEKRKVLDQKRVNLEQWLLNMMCTKEAVQNGLKSMTDKEKLITRERIIWQYRESWQVKLHLLPDTSECLTFTPAQESLSAAIREAGSLESCGFGPKSVAVGDGTKRAWLGRLANFEVHVRDYWGKPVLVGGESVVVMVRTPNGDVHAKVKDRDDGTYVISYKPTLDTRHLVYVTVWGDEVRGSPFDIVMLKGRNYGTVGKMQFQFGSQGSGDGELCRPWGICCDSDGRILVSDRSNSRIQVFDCFGNFLYKFGESGSEPGQLYRPAGIAVDNRDDGEHRVVVADKDNHRIQVFTLDGKFLFSFGKMGSKHGQFTFPWGIAVNGRTHEICVCDARNHRVQLFSPDGHFLKEFCLPSTKQFDVPRSVAFNHDESLVVSDFNNHRLVLISADLKSAMFVSCQGKADGQLLRPQGVAIDNQGNILVADSRNTRICIFSSNGAFLTQFEFAVNNLEETKDANKPLPQGLCVSPNGMIYVIDLTNNRVQVY